MSSRDARDLTALSIAGIIWLVVVAMAGTMLAWHWLIALIPAP